MISLETAKKLKEAGLKWEPQPGDLFYFPDITKTIDFDLETMPHNLSLMESTPSCRSLVKDITERYRELVFIFAPRLDQLLVEIERRGYTIWLNGPRNDEGEEMKWSLSLVGKCRFYSNTPEEAVAQALLWILEREKA